MGGVYVVGSWWKVSLSIGDAGGGHGHGGAILTTMMLVCGAGRGECLIGWAGECLQMRASLCVKSVRAHVPRVFCSSIL